MSWGSSGKAAPATMTCARAAASLSCCNRATIAIASCCKAAISAGVGSHRCRRSSLIIQFTASAGMPGGAMRPPPGAGTVMRKFPSVKRMALHWKAVPAGVVV